MFSSPPPAPLGFVPQLVFLANITNMRANFVSTETVKRGTRMLYSTYSAQGRLDNRAVFGIDLF